jgi:uncharacterized protein YkwD
VPASCPRTRKPVHRLAVRLVAATAVSGALLSASLATGAPAFADSGSKADAFVSHINDARANHGRHTLSVAADLTAVAQAQAERMDKSGTLSHNPNLTTDVKHWLAVGENIGSGGTVDGISSAFMHSPEHRANILDSDYTQVGVGVATDNNGMVWVVEDFRKPDTSYAPTRVHFTHPLRVGSRGPAVSWVQHRLHLRADGVFGHRTHHAVRRFKFHHGLRHNGRVSHKTWRAMHRH